MNIEEMLKIADEIVFTKTGQHLSDLQKAVLRGTLQREKYKQIAKDIEKLSHQSCFILIGWEQPREVPIKSQNTVIRSLQLTGLDVAGGWEILKNYGLEEVDNGEALIQRYQGNLLYLKTVATLIQELGGCAGELLPNDTILLP
jgi:hypothetical protein